MTPLIQLDDVSFAYGAQPVLENVRLTVQEGEFVSMVGPNGGGKSTLVRVMLGLLRPTSGTVRLFGDDPVRTRLLVGYTPQHLNVDGAFPVSVGEIVLSGRIGMPDERSGLLRRLVSGMSYTQEDHAAAVRAMEKMSVADLAERPFGDLSGGQKQRVFIARALVSDPRLLVLDEPTNNIDPTSMERFYELLTELNRTVSILIVTHDLGVVSQYVKSVICVNRHVVVHPTSSLNGTVIRDLYGADVRLVRHDHRCAGEGHVGDHHSG